MKDVTLTINKAVVYDEVAKTTAYAGLKMLADDSTAYARVFTTDEDRQLLERFWVETCNAVATQLSPFMTGISEQPLSHGVDLERNFVVELEMSSSYNETLTGSIEAALHSFFVLAIVSKWYKIANKAEADAVGAEAVGIMADIQRKLFYRQKPKYVAP